MWGKKWRIACLCMTLLLTSCQPVLDTETEWAESWENGMTVEGNTLYLPDTTIFDPEIFSYIDDHMDVQDGFQIVWGKVTLFFGERPDGETTAETCPFTKVEAFGQTLALQTNFQGNHRVALYQTEDYLLLSDTAYTIGDTWLLHDGGIWEQHNDAILYPTNCNDPILYYTVTEDGTITFTCTPRKYVFQGVAGDDLLYSAGWEEIYNITGTAVWDGTEMVHEITDVKTLAEQYQTGELEETWKWFRETIDTTYDSLEEYFAANRQTYGAFAW